MGHFFANKTSKNKKLYNFYIKICKTIRDVPSDLLVSGRRNAIPCQIEPAKRRLMRRAPPQSSAEIQTCFIMYPWQASLPRGRECEEKQSAAVDQRANKKNQDNILHIPVVFSTHSPQSGLARSLPRRRVRTGKESEA